MVRNRFRHFSAESDELLAGRSTGKHARSQYRWPSELNRGGLSRRYSHHSGSSLEMMPHFVFKCIDSGECSNWRIGGGICWYRSVSRDPFSQPIFQAPSIYIYISGTREERAERMRGRCMPFEVVLHAYRPWSWDGKGKRCYASSKVLRGDPGGLENGRLVQAWFG